MRERASHSKRRENHKERERERRPEAVVADLQSSLLKPLLLDRVLPDAGHHYSILRPHSASLSDRWRSYATVRTTFRLMWSALFLSLHFILEHLMVTRFGMLFQ